MHVRTLGAVLALGRMIADFRGRPTCLFRTQCFPEIARFSLNFSAFEVRVMSPV
jgi:hypothetical protein